MNMRKWPRFVISLCLLLSLAWMMVGSAAEPEIPAEKTAYDLYLLIGQSNMAGRGKVDAASTQTHPRVVTLAKDGQWVPAVDPLHFDKPGAGVGPGLAFGKAMAEASPQATIGLIPCAVGGTSITRWVPGVQDPVTKAYPYDDMLKRAQAACKDGTLKGIIWHQGEADRRPDASALYAERLTALIARLRKELNAPDVPFVAGELGQLNETNRELTAGFNTILRGLTQSVARYACVSAEGLTDRGDHLHFNAESARTLGARYAAAMLELHGKGVPTQAPVQQ
jgi:hypothetical protein